MQAFVSARQGDSKHYRSLPALRLAVRISSFLLLTGWLLIPGLLGQTSPGRLPAPKYREDQPATKILFDHVSSELGLSQNVISCLLQDQKGFLWLGTKDGLNRFDGYEFKVFRYDPTDHTSISDSHITSLFEDHLGRIWVGTKKGLNLFNRRQENFTRLNFNPNKQDGTSQIEIHSIVEDMRGAIWIGTSGGGLTKLELPSPEKSEATMADARIAYSTQFPITSGNLSDNLPKQILVDNSGMIWVSVDGNIYHLTEDPIGNDYSITPFKLPEEPKYFLGICRGQNGKIWLAGSRGLFEWDITAHRSIFHPYNPPLFPVSGTMIQDRNGTVWFGAYWGLIRFEPGKKSFEYFPGERAEKNTIFEYGIQSMLEDNNGALWFGANGNGLFRYDKKAERFAHYQIRSGKLGFWRGSSIRSLYETKDGDLLIGPASTAGILRVNRTTGETKPFLAGKPGASLTGITYSKLEFAIGTAYSMIEDKAGALWAGTDRGLLRMNINHGRAENVRTYDLQSGARKNPHGHAAYKLFVDRAGELWAATLYGIYRFDPVTEKFTEFRYEPPDAARPPDSSYPVIHEAPDDFYWIGTTNGLLRFSPREGTFRTYRNDPQNPTALSHNVVRAIAEDPADANILWLGTAGGGLNRFNITAGTFSALTVKDGLPNNVIYAILNDEYGNLWMSTNSGISRFNPRTRVFKNFDVKDGLQDNEFNSCAYLKSRSGELFFGGINGFNAFYPTDVKDNPKPPAVVLTGFQILNRPVSFKTPDSPLKQTITETKEVTFRYNQRFFSFDFAALDFTEPGKNQYAYKLEGFDPDWIQNGTRRTAFYTNIPPGSYTFHVIAANNDGIWNSEGTSIRVTVLPPFWLTWWFLTILSAGLIAIGYLLYRRRISRFERANSLQEAFSRQLIEEQENDRKRIAAELHDGLGQSLLIIKNRAFLGAQATEIEGVPADGSGSAREQFTEISDSAAEALEQVREIAYYLRPSQLERLGLVSAIEEMIDQVATSSSIQFDVQLAQIDGVFPPELEINFYRIVQESLNNILRHSGATRAKVTVKHDENGIELLISDNGKGFTYDEAGLVLPSKTGFGLKGMQERARILGGHYTIRSSPGEGTSILVQINNRNIPHEK